jgi:flagellin
MKLYDDTGVVGSATTGATAGTFDTTTAGAISIDVTDPAGTTTTTTINFAANATIDDINKSIKDAGIDGLSVATDGSQLYFANRSLNDIDVDATAAGFTAAVNLAAGTASDKAILDKNYDYFDGTAFKTVSIDSIDISKLTDSADDLNVLNQYVEIVDKALGDVTQSSADLGATKTRIDSNSNFVKSLRDAIDRGVGQLVDADMNAESTRLQALQVQQQLGIQALSIANSSSQSILSLFQ